jgi:hypothetical protein
MNRYQQMCVISSQKIQMSGTGQAGNTALAELLVRRWKEDRPYFMLDEHTRGVWLQASWLPR